MFLSFIFGRKAFVCREFIMKVVCFFFLVCYGRNVIHKSFSCLFIPAMPPNDRGYGHLAVCGSVRCRGTTKGMREQHLLIARQPASAHRRVLPAGLGCKEFVFRFLSSMFLFSRRIVVNVVTLVNLFLICKPHKYSFCLQI